MRMELKQARQAKGLTQKELADKIGTSKSVISNYETGYATPKLDRMIKLSEILDVDISIFLKKDVVDNT